MSKDPDYPYKCAECDIPTSRTCDLCDEPLCMSSCAYPGGEGIVICKTCSLLRERVVEALARPDWHLTDDPQFRRSFAALAVLLIVSVGIFLFAGAL